MAKVNKKAAIIRFFAGRENRRIRADWMIHFKMMRCGCFQVACCADIMRSVFHFYFHLVD